MLTSPRIDDDEALRAKVQEALTVYDEYMKNRPTEGANGTKEEDGAQADSAEATAA